MRLAKRAGAEVLATTTARGVEYVRGLHADRVIDIQECRFEVEVKSVDAVIDTVGGDTLERSFAVLKPGGALVSAAAQPDKEKAAAQKVRAVFFIVEVTTEALSRIAELFESGELKTHVGDVLPLSEARAAHEMLAGKPHRPGKIVSRCGVNGGNDVRFSGSTAGATRAVHS